MTKTTEARRCRWCGRRFDIVVGVRGRPRLYCRSACRQREYEARLRASEAGLAESELVVARTELDRLYDQLYVLEAAIEDVQRDLAVSSTKRDYEEALAWVLDAAKPLIHIRLGEVTIT
ncbi:MAG: hypothetical protein ACRD0U_07655 [Acidimicrobiales bacterium]